MSRIETLSSTVESRFGPRLRRLDSVAGGLTYEVAAAGLTGVCLELRDSPELAFEQLVDLSAIDYLDHGRGEWNTAGATSTGFSRGVSRVREAGDAAEGDRRFAVACHLLSVSRNWRLR